MRNVIRVSDGVLYYRDALLKETIGEVMRFDKDFLSRHNTAHEEMEVLFEQCENIEAAVTLKTELMDAIRSAYHKYSENELRKEHCNEVNNQV